MVVPHISNKLDWACVEEKSDPLDIFREDPNVKIVGNLQHSISRIVRNYRRRL